MSSVTTNLLTQQKNTQWYPLTPMHQGCRWCFIQIPPSGLFLGTVHGPFRGSSQLKSWRASFTTHFGTSTTLNASQSPRWRGAADPTHVTDRCYMIDHQRALLIFCSWWKRDPKILLLIAHICSTDAVLQFQGVVGCNFDDCIFWKSCGPELQRMNLVCMALYSIYGSYN